MKPALRVSLLSLSALVWSVAARAQDELAKVQAGDEVHEPVAHHVSSPVPQFDPHSFPGQLFWLAIIFTLLYVVMSRIVLPRIGTVVDKRAAQIARDLEQAQADRIQAGELLDAHERGLGDARARAQAATAEAVAQAAKAQAAALSEQGTRLASDLSAAETRLAAARATALSELAPSAAGATQAIVAKLTGQTVDAAQATAAVTAALQSRKAA